MTMLAKGTIISNPKRGWCQTNSPHPTKGHIHTKPPWGPELKKNSRDQQHVFLVFPLGHGDRKSSFVKRHWMPHKVPPSVEVSNLRPKHTNQKTLVTKVEGVLQSFSPVRIKKNIHLEKSSSSPCIRMSCCVRLVGIFLKLWDCESQNPSIYLYPVMRLLRQYLDNDYIFRPKWCTWTTFSSCMFAGWEIQGSL